MSPSGSKLPKQNQLHYTLIILIYCIKLLLTLMTIIFETASENSQHNELYERPPYNKKVFRTTPNFDQTLSYEDRTYINLQHAVDVDCSRLSIGHIIIMLGFPELASSLLHTIASDVQPSLRQNKAGGYFSDRPVQPKLHPSVSPRCTTEYWVETTTDELSKQQSCGW